MTAGPPPTARPALDVRRELDELIPEYQPAPGPRLRRYSRWLLKAIAASLLALLTVAAIVYVLHFHLRQAETAPPPKKPVTVQIIPAQK